MRAVSGWSGGGVNGRRGWRVLAMGAVQAMRSVHALLAVEARPAGVALSATFGRTGVGGNSGTRDVGVDERRVARGQLGAAGSQLRTSG